VKSCEDCGENLQYEQLTYCEKCLNRICEESIKNLKQLFEKVRK
jgi:hypothetical protein